MHEYITRAYAQHIINSLDCRANILGTHSSNIRSACTIRARALSLSHTTNSRKLSHTWAALLFFSVGGGPLGTEGLVKVSYCTNCRANKLTAIKKTSQFARYSSNRCHHPGGVCYVTTCCEAPTLQCSAISRAPAVHTPPTHAPTYAPTHNHAGGGSILQHSWAVHLAYHLVLPSGIHDSRARDSDP